MTDTHDSSDNGLDRGWLLLFGAWLLVSAASLGSMFFSEIMELPPCSLCWYQRIFMFPLPVVLLMGLFPYDPKAVRYALPLALLGTLVALYHTLLQVGILPASMAQCSSGVSCIGAEQVVFGFVSIPLLSLLAFATVAALLIASTRISSR